MQPKLILILIILSTNFVEGQTILKAINSDDTYQLITDILAPGGIPIEVPDTDHTSSTKHIREVWDAELNTYVFAFDIHLNTDKDKGNDNDKQRNEIKTYGGSPDDLLGVANETIVYRWKFKLDANFQCAQKSTLLHQIKSVGGVKAEESQPLIALIAHTSGTNDLLRIRYVRDSSTIEYLASEDLDNFRDVWVQVEETITYGESGSYKMVLKSISNGTLLMEYTNPNIRMWKTGADFIRPKWGIYRFIITPEDLRNETVLFDEFSIIEINTNCIDNESSLNTAFNNAAAGDIITLCNGVWEDLQISINANGTAQNPIIIQAETPGLVQLTGDSRISIGGSHIILNGFTFINGQPTNSFVVDFKASDGTFCTNCTLQNTTFDNYNPTDDHNVRWVRMHGNYNEVAHCSFLNKKSIGSCILVERPESGATTPNHHKIHHNYFAHRRPQNDIFNDQNDQDAIRIGFSGTSLSNSNSMVYNNYFYDWEGEIEIISNKSGGNLYFNNTFDTYSGALTLRHGNNCEVFNNFFFARNGFKSGGVRVIGEGHKIFNNYIEGINNGSSNAVGAINISNGKPNSALNEYLTAKNIQVVFNTIVDSDKGIRVGTQVNNSLTEEPENIIIANNLMVDCFDAIEEVTEPIGAYPYIANTRKGGSWDIPSNFANDVTTDDLLTNINIDGFKRALVGSAAANSAIGTYIFVNRDITGALRPTTDTQKDGGAEEANSEGKNRPYNQTDIGTKIGVASGLSYTCHHKNLDINYFSVPDGIIQTSLNLESNSTITTSKNVTFKAGQTVLLKPGFEVHNGVDFLATIEDCASEQRQVASRTNESYKSLNEENRVANLVVYPNPVHQLLTIEYFFEKPMLVQLNLVSVDGKTNLIVEKTTLKSKGFHQFKIPINNLSSGMYIVKAIIGKEIMSKKVLILK